jgi:hypothetical protein
MVRTWVSYAVVAVLGVIWIVALQAAINSLVRVINSIARHLPERYVLGRRLLSLLLLVIGACVIAIVFMTTAMVVTYAIWG